MALEVKAGAGQAASDLKALAGKLDGRIGMLEKGACGQAEEVLASARTLDARIRRLEEQAGQQANRRATAAGQAPAKDDLESIGVEVLQRLDKKRIELDMYARQLLSRLMSHETNTKQRIFAAAGAQADPRAAAAGEALQQSLSECAMLREALNSTVSMEEHQVLRRKAAMLETQIVLHRQEIEEHKKANASLQKQVEIYTAVPKSPAPALPPVGTPEVQFPVLPPTGTIAGNGIALNAPALVVPVSLEQYAAEAAAADTGLTLVVETTAGGQSRVIQPSGLDRQASNKSQPRVAERISPVVIKQASSPGKTQLSPEFKPAAQLSPVTPAISQPVASAGVSSAFPKAGIAGGSGNISVAREIVSPRPSAASTLQVPVTRAKEVVSKSTAAKSFSGAALQGSAKAGVGGPARMAASPSGIMATAPSATTAFSNGQRLIQPNTRSI